MVKTRPQVEPTTRYSIAATCKNLGICLDTLRKHSTLGNIERRYDAVGEIYYLGSDILGFWDKQDRTGCISVRRGRRPKNSVPSI